MKYVRRSMREAGASRAKDSSSRLVKLLRENSTCFQARGRVLRMKQYLPADAGPKVIDAVVDALAENTLVEALYIQNFEKGMHDAQVRLPSRARHLPPPPLGRSAALAPAPLSGPPPRECSRGASGLRAPTRTKAFALSSWMAQGPV